MIKHGSALVFICRLPGKEIWNSLEIRIKNFAYFTIHAAMQSPEKFISLLILSDSAAFLFLTFLAHVLKQLSFLSMSLFSHEL